MSNKFAAWWRENTSNDALRKLRIPKSVGWLFRGVIRRHYVTGLGLSVIMWAHVEYCLDGAVDLAFKVHNTDIEPEVPRSFKRKTSYLRRAWQLPYISTDMQTRGLALLKKADALSLRRHSLVHSIARNQISESFKVVTKRFLYEKESLSREEVEVHLLDLAELMDEAYRLTTDLIDFVDAWAEIVLAHVTEQAASLQKIDSSRHYLPISKA